MIYFTLYNMTMGADMPELPYLSQIRWDTKNTKKLTIVVWMQMSYFDKLSPSFSWGDFNNCVLLHKDKMRHKELLR